MAALILSSGGRVVVELGFFVVPGEFFIFQLLLAQRQADVRSVVVGLDHARAQHALGLDILFDQAAGMLRAVTGAALALLAVAIKGPLRQLVTEGDELAQDLGLVGGVFVFRPFEGFGGHCLFHLKQAHLLCRFGFIEIFDRLIEIRLLQLYADKLPAHHQ